MKIIHGMDWTTFFVISAVGFGIAGISYAIALLIYRSRNEDLAKAFFQLAVMVGFSTGMFFFGSIVISIIASIWKALFSR